MIRGLWDRETVALLMIAAVAPLAAAWLWYGGVPAALRLVMMLLIAGAWHLIFLLARAQPPSYAGALTALAVAMLAPGGLGPLQIALGLSFGVVMGELVFGGWGRNIVNPATVTAMFLGFGFPAAGWPGVTAPLAWAAIGGVALGVGFGVMSARLAAGAIVAAAIAWAAGMAPDRAWMAAAVVFVLLVADPVTSAATALGRWLEGAAYAGLVVLFAANWQGATPVQLSVAAAFLASLAAPLLDELALWAWLQRRGRIHG
ncbi:RnfABCDGE type electron transport complex subunit D [uncultured Paracoccus sp.]|uniref:RnfABCDGE type electron transport complex subunit D n=1 Tax=uncultured Paracoccus sp. TaxID=189685 RepID=UPI002623D083|nr:RnfABCDGE type electron transport complex subunit D [uncultured Paracoccus sp.]